MEDINIALLIDADNISAKYISGILSELSKYGKITVRRMYGDWSQERLRNWLSAASGYSLTPMMQQNNTPGKNASDICMIIDAMDILYTGEVQGFCIASSDGDFNKLATRLREAGKFVIGMGEKKTPECFRVSCERFIFLDVIEDVSEEEELNPTKSTAKAKSASSKKTASRQKKNVSETDSDMGGVYFADSPAVYTSYVMDANGIASYRSDAAENADSEFSRSSTADTDTGADTDTDADTETGADGMPLFTDKATIENAIIKMISDNSAEGKETGLGEIGSRLVKIFPDFDTRNYHFSKLSEYLKDFPSLSVTNRDNAVWVSLKGASDAEIEQQIFQVFRRHKCKEMELSTLKRELMEINPSLNATIKKSGVTRFSVYLKRKIHSLEVNGPRVRILLASKKGEN